MAALPATVDSGFRPGVDDWQFTNYGSYVAPTGHCEGQSVSAIWYYVNQRLGGGASPLYGLYDDNGGNRPRPSGRTTRTAIGCLRRPDDPIGIPACTRLPRSQHVRCRTRTTSSGRRSD